jgi:hypothetical protein
VIGLDKNDPNKQPANPFAIYREKYAHMNSAQRVAEAANQTGVSLLALCHDADPRVIKRVLDNHSSGLDHARLIAKVHKTSVGLGFVCNNPTLAKDERVQRNLLKNSVLSESQLRTILIPKNLKQTWKIATGTELTQNNKSRARNMVKEKFTTASPEEKAAFIFDTEGRVLILLSDVPLGEKTIALLCRRTYISMLLIQNLVKFSKTPPKLLKRLEVQSIVKHNEGLKRRIKMHPNYPKSGIRSNR